VKRVLNTNALFRCVFGSRDSPLNVRRTLRIWLCAYVSDLNYIKPSCILPYPRLSLEGLGEFRLG
jgi:hypothetical protein